MLRDMEIKCDTFSESALQDRVEIEGDEETQAEVESKIKISGIITVEGEALAIVNGRIVREGDEIGGMKIIEITVDGITVSHRGKRWTIQ